MADKLNKIIKRFFLIFFVGITIAFVIYCFFISSPTKIFKSFFSDDNKEKLSDIDNINGIYSRKLNLNTSYSIYRSCTVSSINYYLLIINDKYNYYESSCLITRLLSSGKVEDLDINKNKETNKYYIKYKNNIYNKDLSVDEIIPKNSFMDNHNTVEIESINFIIKNLNSSNDLFEFDSELKGNNKARVSFGKQSNLISQDQEDEDEVVEPTISNVDDNYMIQVKGSIGEGLNEEQYKYDYIINDFNQIPYFYSFGKSYSVIEPLIENDNYKYNLKLINTTYNLKDQFPITIDGESINYNDYNVFIYYDIYKTKFRVFFSKYKDFCGEESNEDSIIYYEFEVSYNYSKINLNKPEFVKVVKVKDNCNEIKKLMKEK